MLKIGDFSKLAKTTVKTIRYYDDIGLLPAAFVDTNGYRYYDIEQLNDLIRIIELRQLDISISDIQLILSSPNPSQNLIRHLDTLTAELTRKNNQISMLNNLIAQVVKGEYMNKYKAREIMVPANIVYYKHGVIEDMSHILDFVLSAGAEAKQHNPNLKCKDYCYVAYTAKEYKERDVELEYAEAVEDWGKDSDNIHFRQDQEIKAIAVTHLGDYAGLAQAYAYALNWVNAHGYTIAGDIREVYIDGCWNKSDPAEYLTEIQIPVIITKQTN